MIRFGAALILITGLLCSQWLRTFTFGAYQRDKVGFTLRYCENISKPNLKCQGMCHLKKLLAELNENEKGKDAQETEVNIMLYQQHREKISFYSLLIQSITFSEKVVPTTMPCRTSVFHPPSAAGSIVS